MSKQEAFNELLSRKKKDEIRILEVLCNMKKTEVWVSPDQLIEYAAEIEMLRTRTQTINRGLDIPQHELSNQINYMTSQRSIYRTLLAIQEEKIEKFCAKYNDVEEGILDEQEFHNMMHEYILRNQNKNIVNAYNFVIPLLQKIELNE